MCSVVLTRSTASGGREVLLGLKKKGFGAGHVVAPGGKIEPDETPAEAAARELKEETGITADPAELTEFADLTFRFPARPEWDLRMHVFVATRFRGEPRESDEIAARWIPVAEVPLDGMWDDARLWLPRVLSGEYVAAVITFADDNETVASSEPVG